MDFRKCCKRAALLLLISALAGAQMPVSALAATRAPAPAQAEFDPSNFYLDEPEPKDPFVAGLLSWSWTGLGQFYTQNYARGSLFLATDIAQKGLLVYMIFYYSDKYRSGNDIVRWEDISARDRGIIIGYIFSILFVKVLSVVDAVHCADEYNREIYFPYWKHQNRTRLSIEPDRGQINVSLTQSFNLF